MRHVNTIDSIMLPEPAKLALAAGRFQESAPEAPLTALFASRWLYRSHGPTATEVNILPDGYLHLRWINGALSIAGPTVQARAQKLSPAAAVVGWRLQHGTASRWLGLPLTEMVGQCLPLEEVWGSRAQRLAVWAGESDDAEEIRRRVEHGIAELTRSYASVNADAHVIFDQLSAVNDGGDPNVDTLCRQLNLSARTLHRRCCELFGYGPKTLQRILRFQRFLRPKENHPGGLADRAFDAGYADHAHLARESRRLAGLAPSTIARLTTEKNRPKRRNVVHGAK